MEGLIWYPFVVLLIWNKMGYIGDNTATPLKSPVRLMYTIDSGPDSVVTAGDLSIVSGTNGANIHSYIKVDDIVVVKDKRQVTQLYTQKVTDLFTSIDYYDHTANMIVQINYQAKHSDPLEKKWFAQQDVVGKVVFVLPGKYSLYVLIVAVILTCQPWLYIQAAGTLCSSLLRVIQPGPALVKIALIAVMFLDQATLVS